MSKQGRIHIGTSGWHYKHWRGPFYPLDMPEERYLAYYAERFDTVEINNSFYHLPEEGTLSQWRQTTSKDFGFSVKGSRHLTHMKKLKDPQELLSRFLGRVESLKRKLGPVLFQLPPRWKANPQRLEEFLQVLPRRPRCAFEFRDRSWFSDAIYELLSRHHAAYGKSNRNLSNCLISQARPAP